MTRQKGASPSRNGRPFDSPSLSVAMNGWLQHRLANWPQIWAACIKRIHSWRVPPRWNLPDWWEEIDAESIAAACHALRIFDPSRGPEIGTFVYHQMLASALARYRREWTYAIRYGVSGGEDAGVTETEDRFAMKQEEEKLKQILTNLPDSDRSLIKYLFWEGRTETEVANGLGISQQAVSKRKHKILSELRETFGEGNESRRTRKRKQKL
jgi:RNA polymerase sigma factor (sigma-70 family)